MIVESIIIMSMIRTQIQLTEEQAENVKRVAAERGISMAEVIREGIDRVLADEGRADRWDRALAATGKFHSGLRDVSERHDEYLAEDFAR